MKKITGMKVFGSLFATMQSAPHPIPYRQRNDPARLARAVAKRQRRAAKVRAVA